MVGVSRHQPTKDVEKDDRTTEFTFEFKDFFDMNGQVHSPEHEFGGFRWRLLLFPKGNSVRKVNLDHFSLYLDCQGPSLTSEGKPFNAWFNRLSLCR